MAFGFDSRMALRADLAPMTHAASLPPAAARPRRALAAAAALACAFAAALAAPPAATAQERAQSLPTIRLTAGIHKIDAEVARTPGQHQIGLMHRPSMPPNAGMLFVFDEKAQRCFWMRNTLIPLQIAFLDDDGTVVNVESMKALDESNHCATKPVRYALEMNAGWFDRRGIKAGAHVKGIPKP